jgi:uncharacterized protein (TIGR03437 family)
MHRNVKLSFTLCVLVAGITFAQAPVVPQGGVVSAASLLPLGAPGYQLSPGGIVSIFGTNLGTSTTGVGATTIPLTTSLGGASVTIGSVPAPLYFVSASQINAQIPYSVTPGAAVPVVVTTSAGSSAASTIPVVAAAPAIFTFSQNGLGNAAAQNYVSTSSTPANGFNAAIAQGGILIVYGTGGGAITGGPATGAACAGGTFSAAYSATLAGQTATVNYAGCAPGFVGLDQWNIVVPSTVPTGCSIPLQVTVGGVSSNAATISVAGNGNCSSAVTGQPQVGPGQSYGALELFSTTISIPGFNLPASGSFTGIFQKNGAVAVTSSSGFPPANAGCFVETYKVSSSSSTPSTVGPTGSTGIDAGILTVKTPSSSFQLSPTSIGSYSSPTSGFPAITPGSYSVSGAGGANVGPFGPVTLNIPAVLNVTNPGYTGSSISASAGMNPAMTCPDPAGEIVAWVISTSSSNIQGLAICTFSCSSNIVIPSSVLKQLPLSSSGGADVAYFFLPPNNNAGVTSAQFSASGLNLGLFYFISLYEAGGLTLTP